MIVMSLDVSKDHVLKKIMNNLNWLGKDTNVFCLLYIYIYIYAILFLSMLVNTNIAAKSNIQFLS